MPTIPSPNLYNKVCSDPHNHTRNRQDPEITGDKNQIRSDKKTKSNQVNRAREIPPQGLA